MTETTTPQGLRCAPEDVWARVRDDYLAGLSAPECCRRHGVGLTTLRDRAAREGWRRIDQPWTPPNRLDPWDEGVELELKVGGDLDKVELRELWYVAHRRMMRAVMRGDAVEALRWRRVSLVMDQATDEMNLMIEREEAEFWHARNREMARDPDGSDGSDGVFSPEPGAPPTSETRTDLT